MRAGERGGDLVLVVVFEEAEGDLLGWSDLLVGRSTPVAPPYNAASVHRRACLALPVTSVTGVPDGLPYRVWPAAVGLLLL